MSTFEIKSRDRAILTYMLSEGKKYGYDFFSSMPTSLSAVGDLPLPADYRISLRDQLRVILSGSKDQIFIKFVTFWRSYGQTDLIIKFYVKFCSRTTFPEVCTTQICENFDWYRGKS